MLSNGTMVAEQRKYRVRTVADAKAIAVGWLESVALAQAVTLGLPENDDRHHIGRVPLRRLTCP